MKKLLVILFCVFSFNAAIAQEKPQKKYEPQRRNSVYLQNFIVFPTINYDRVIPFGNHLGVIVKAGVGFYGGILPIFEASFYAGGKRHFGEIGAGYWAFEGAVLNANYRYMGKRGLLVKVGLGYIPGEEAFPLLALGYSF